jgi:hypothetical protein
LARLLQLSVVGLLISAYALYVEAPQVFDRWSPARTVAINFDDPALAVSDNGPTVITPAQALGVAKALLRWHDDGLAQLNGGAIAKVEVEPARGYDLSVIAYALANSQRLTSERGTAVAVIVPRQSSYPAYFLAVVSLTTLQGAVPAESGALIVAVRADRSSPWRLSYITEWGGSAHQFTPTLDEQGYAMMPPGSVSDVAINPAAVPDLVAKYWQGWRTDGAAPGDPQSEALAPGPWTTELGPTLRRHGQRGRTNVTAYRVDGADSIYLTRVDLKSELECFTVRVDETDTFTAPGTFQDPWRSLWGPLLPAGIYSEVRTSGIEMSCAIVRPGALPGSVTLLGRTGGPVTLAGAYAGADALLPFVSVFVLFAFVVLLSPLLWLFDRRANQPSFPPYGFLTLEQTHPSGWEAPESAATPALEAPSLDELVRRLVVAAAERSPDQRPPTLRYAWTDAAIGTDISPARGTDEITLNVRWETEDVDDGLADAIAPRVQDSASGTYRAEGGEVSLSASTLESLRGSAPAGVLGQTSVSGVPRFSKIRFLVEDVQPVTGLPEAEPASIEITPSRFETLRPLTAGLIAGSAIFGSAVSSDLARAIWNKDWATIGVVLLLFGVAVACFGVVAWLYATQAKVTADESAVTSRDLFGRTTRIPRAEVATVMICSVLIRKGLPAFQSRIFLLDSDGRVVLKLYGSFWSEADFEALARFLGVELVGSRADWYRPADLARVAVGSVTIFERHPRLIWVAAGAAWLIVLILVRVVVNGVRT